MAVPDRCHLTWMVQLSLWVQHKSYLTNTVLYITVPSDIDELNSKNKIKHALCKYNRSEHIIIVEEMTKAISKICGEKSDGDGQLWSNHIIYAPGDLSVHLSVLMTGIIVPPHKPAIKNSHITTKRQACLILTITYAYAYVHILQNSWNGVYWLDTTKRSKPYG